MKYHLFNCFLFLFISVSGMYANIPLLEDDVNILNQIKASLMVKAAVYFGDQYEETVPINAEFHILDKSLVRILKEANLKPEFEEGPQRNQKLTEEDYLEAVGKAFIFPDEESETIKYLINRAIKTHQLSTIKTNNSGEGISKSIKKGNYYFFGVSKTEAEVFVWHSEIEIKPGKNIIEIDQNNAAVVFSID